MLANLLFWRRPRVVVVELHGLLARREGALNLKSVGPAVERAFRAAAAHGGHVVLDIDCRGGSAVQSELIAALIRRHAAKSSASVHAVIQEVGASGGYWLACAADEIRANAMSIVGSIGVIGGGFGVTELLARAGIERRLYTAGENKARLDPFSPERPQDVAFVRQLLADIHERFKAYVRSRRGARLKGTDAEMFDGSFFLGDRALALGLIDGFSDIDRLVHELGGDRAVARVFRPRRARGLLSRLPRLAGAELAEAALDAIEARALPRL
ncbi:MAG: S49 family peptidase [Acidisphaera sp.]|nr:S49 family peptidase [Acidisphaera sp.]